MKLGRQDTHGEFEEVFFFGRRREIETSCYVCDVAKCMLIYLNNWWDTITRDYIIIFVAVKLLYQSFFIPEQRKRL
jgi:hypothetical protein